MPTMHSYLIHTGVVTTLALAIVRPTPAHAQTSQDTARARVCVLALRIAARGLHGEEPAEEGDRTPLGRRMDRAWNLLQRCGRAGGVAAGAAWRQLRAVSDTSQLQAMYTRIWSFRDASVFDAAAAVATDPSATRKARVYSLMLLTTQLFDQWNPAYRQFVGATTPYRVCLFDAVYDRAITTGAPLPANARARARTLARRLAENTSTPPEVQSAGRCLDQAITTTERVEAAEPIRPPGT